MLPVILYDINRNQITSDIIPVIGSNIYIYSPTEFKIEIIKNRTYNACIYSVTNIGGNLATLRDDVFEGNIGYSIVFNIDDVSEYGITDALDILISNATGYSKVYTLVRTEAEVPEHYEDLLVNNDLPSLEELQPAFVNSQYSNNKREILKRLLLDFKHILRSKGTVQSIEKFFKLIGFENEQFKVFVEFVNPNTQEKTFSPDTLVDVKTGDYAVLYENWKHLGKHSGEHSNLDSNNLPLRKFSVDNIESLLDALQYAIPLANRYFTATEQDIVFFGVTFSSNNPRFQNILSFHDICNHINPTAYRKKLEINFSTWNADSETILVKNNIQTSYEAYNSERKFTTENKINPNTNIFWIDSELNDYENEQLEEYQRCFGASILGKIFCENLFVNICVENLDSTSNDFITKDINFKYITYSNVNFVTRKNGKYKITVTTTDTYNNREKYEYVYEVKESKVYIDFETFTSINMFVDNINDQANINLDTSSGTEVTKNLSNNLNYILDINSIPESLSNYFKINPTQLSRFLSKASTHPISKSNPQYFLESINTNIPVDSVTEMPVALSEQFLEFCILPDNVWTPEFEKIINSFKDAPDVETILRNGLTRDKLFISKLKIYEPTSDTEYEVIFLCTTETGINLKYVYPELFEVKALTNIPVHRIPVNYDFPLFTNVKQDGILYVSKDCYRETVEDIEFPVVRSLFPRLKKYGLHAILRGDCILVRLNSNLVVNETNVKWTLKNGFTGETLFTTTDYALKYRINEKCSFDIYVEFEIYGKRYEIVRKDILSTYTL